MNGHEELNENGPEEIPEGPIPAYRGEAQPTGKVDQVMWWAFRGKTRKELEKPPYNQKKGTIRVGFSKLAGLEPDWVEAQEKPDEPAGDNQNKLLPAAAAAQKRPMQIFAKGSPPETIIESITIPMVEGQSQGFEMGMKFGMSQLVLAVRIMQELSAIGLQQVKPLIDMTRSVREGEAAAFRGGADEGAMKAAQAMGATIMPMMSEMQTMIANSTKSNEVDPMKAMMIRTMEPLMKNMMKNLMPGMEGGPPTGFTKEIE